MPRSRWGALLCRDPQRTCCFFFLDEPSAPGRSAAKKKKKIIKKDYLLQKAGGNLHSALPAAMPVGARGRGRLCSRLPPLQHRTHNAHACREIEPGAPQMLGTVALRCSKPGFTGFLTCINLCPYALDCLQLLREHVCLEASRMTAEILFNRFACKRHHYLYSTGPAFSAHPGTPLILF